MNCRVAAGALRMLVTLNRVLLVFDTLPYNYYRVNLGVFKRQEVSILLSVKRSLLDMTVVGSLHP